MFNRKYFIISMWKIWTCVQRCTTYGWDRLWTDHSNAVRNVFSLLFSFLQKPASRAPYVWICAEYDSGAAPHVTSESAKCYIADTYTHNVIIELISSYHFLHIYVYIYSCCIATIAQALKCINQVSVWFAASALWLWMPCMQTHRMHAVKTIDNCAKSNVRCCCCCCSGWGWGCVCNSHFGLWQSHAHREKKMIKTHWHCFIYRYTHRYNDSNNNLWNIYMCYGREHSRFH